MNFGGGQINNVADWNDVFVAKLGPGGQHAYSYGFGDPDNQGAMGVAAGPDGYVVVGGYFFGAIDFGGGPIVAKGNDGFLLRLAP